MKDRIDQSSINYKALIINDLFLKSFKTYKLFYKLDFYNTKDLVVPNSLLNKNKLFTNDKLKRIFLKRYFKNILLFKRMLKQFNEYDMEKRMTFLEYRYYQNKLYFYDNEKFEKELKLKENNNINKFFIYYKKLKFQKFLSSSIRNRYLKKNILKKKKNYLFFFKNIFQKGKNNFVLFSKKNRFYKIKNYSNHNSNFYEIIKNFNLWIENKNIKEKNNIVFGIKINKDFKIQEDIYYNGYKWLNYNNLGNITLINRLYFLNYFQKNLIKYNKNNIKLKNSSTKKKFKFKYFQKFLIVKNRIFMIKNQKIKNYFNKFLFILKIFKNIYECLFYSNKNKTTISKKLNFILTIKFIQNFVINFFVLKNESNIITFSHNKKFNYILNKDINLLKILKLNNFKIKNRKRYNNNKSFLFKNLYNISLFQHSNLKFNNIQTKKIFNFFKKKRYAFSNYFYDYNIKRKFRNNINKIFKYLKKNSDLKKKKLLKKERVLYNNGKKNKKKVMIRDRKRIFKKFRLYIYVNFLKQNIYIRKTSLSNGINNINLIIRRFLSNFFKIIRKQYFLFNYKLLLIKKKKKYKGDFKYFLLKKGKLFDKFFNNNNILFYSIKKPVYIRNKNKLKEFKKYINNTLELEHKLSSKKFFIMRLTTKRRNLFIVLLNKKGKIFLKTSAGVNRDKTGRVKKNTPFSIQRNTENLLQKLIIKKKLKDFRKKILIYNKKFNKSLKEKILFYKGKNYYFFKYFYFRTSSYMQYKIIKARKKNYYFSMKKKKNSRIFRDTLHRTISSKLQTKTNIQLPLYKIIGFADSSLKNRKIKASFKAIKKNRGFLWKIINNIRRPHNGCKRKKVKRI